MLLEQGFLILISYIAITLINTHLSYGFPHAGKHCIKILQ